MKKQYIVQKYVMAESVTEALKKSKTMAVHEVFVHNSWFDKAGMEFFPNAGKQIGLRHKKK